jgi:hypothetical protein
MQFLTIWLAVLADRMHSEDERDDRADRGDVPGWVMVTVMSAILVVAILAVFEPQIKNAVTSAINSVSGSK